MKPCILPWINFSTTTFGRPRVCGYSDDATIKLENRRLRNSDIETEWNNEYFKQIRRDFLADQWPDNCKRCKYVEELDGMSKRLDENSYWHAQYKHLIAQTNPDGSVDYAPPHIDVRTGTTCNLKCIHCGTGASSKWNEDKALIGKYENVQDIQISNKWIDTDHKFWDSLKQTVSTVKRYNFLGGESFANKRHNEFLTFLTNSGHAHEVRLAYVTNGILLNKQRMDQLAQFKDVVLRISLDAIGDPLEFFRFPTQWDVIQSRLAMLNEYAKLENLDIGIQWTCSNVSIFYFKQTYEYVTKNYPNIKFLLCNHVEFPIHMSAQVLPVQLKQQIKKEWESIDYLKSAEQEWQFYVNHMLELDLWDTHKSTLLNYFNDLDALRHTNWRVALKEMKLDEFM
jgi:sulfatase maturation enzyme AslB (radical SAM superfamily)